MEKSWELKHWRFVVPDLIARIKTETKGNAERPTFVNKNLDDEQIMNMAKGFCQAMNLPHKCLSFAVNELQGYRTFYQRNIEGYEILTAPRLPVYETAYSQPVKFIIRNKATGITSLPTQNVDVQLKNWGL